MARSVRNLMATLRIDYDADAIEAVLATDQPDRHWDVVVRTLREQTDDWHLPKPNELRVPWWAFAASRKAIGYQIAVGNIATEFGDAARALLLRASDREELLERAAQIAPLSNTEIYEKFTSNGFVRKLMSFQEKNLRALCRLPVGATFSVPGAGKTTEALAFFAFLRKENSKLLVIAPKNAFAAWEEQSAICLPDAAQFIRLQYGKAHIQRILSNLKPDFMLVTYEQFPTVTRIIARYLSQYHSFIFLDESHRIKGGEGKVRANAVLRIAPVANHKLVLSGTPLPNSINDLVPQWKFIASELSPATRDPVEEMKPFFVRTKKSDLELPDPSRALVSIPMKEEQRRLYNLLRSEMARETESSLGRPDRRAFRRIGRSAIRLLQYTSNPSLLVGKIPEFDQYLGDVIEEGDSPKLEWACRRARQLARQSRKIIIWSSFVENVEILADRLADIGADFIHGGVEASSEAEADSREEKIARFHKDDSAMVLVANPAACGEGISLHTVCHHALYVDRSYNAAQYLQSEDRIHRIGSDEQKYVEILVCPDSIDDSVDRRLKEKIHRMADALNDESLRVSPVSIDTDHIDLDADDVTDLIRHLHDHSRAA